MTEVVPFPNLSFPEHSGGILLSAVFTNTIDLESMPGGRVVVSAADLLL
jgi:hypothetical protein